MSSMSGTTYDQTTKRSSENGYGGWSNPTNWGCTNIAVMVLGFILFWPIGLFLLFWVSTGRHVGDLARAIKEKLARLTEKLGSGNGFTESTSGNVVFEEYQQTQYDRIREIRDEIKNRAQRFSSYREDAKRRADEEEFRQFMSDNPGSTEG